MLKILVTILCSLFCLNSEKDEIVTYKIMGVPFDIMTPVGIDCDQLQTILYSQLTTIEINNNAEIDTLFGKLEKAQLYEDQSYSIDTRARIYIKHNSGKVDTLCLERSQLFRYRGKVYDYGNYDLVYYISDLEDSIAVK